MTLDQLKINQKAIIEYVNAEAVPQKLMDMGFIPGNLIELIQKAPFNDPLYFLVGESHITIRKELAREITINLI